MTSNKYNILLVDDDPSDFELIREYLEAVEDSPYTLNWLQGYDSAVKEIRSKSKHYDAVLIDYILGGKSGLDLLRFALEIKYDSPILILTGNGNIEVDKKALKIGASDYFPKSMLNSEFLDRSIRHSIERKRNEFLVRRQQQELGKVIRKAAISDLVSTILHEINNPLASIQGKLMKMSRLLLEPECDRNGIENLCKESLGLINKIVQLKEAVRRFHGHQTKNQMESFKVVDLVKDAVSICERNISVSGAKVLIEIPEQIELQCMPTELTQVFINLISNSCDAIKNLDERNIKVFASDLGETVSINVSDSGLSPSLDISDKMFNDFFTTKENGESSGIGLSLSKKIITWHNGTINSDPGSFNTCINICLPKLQEIEDRVFNILIVDDDIEVLDLVKELFNESFFQIVGADNGLDAARLLKEQTFDAVITDIEMPGIDGIELFNSVQNNSSILHPPEFFFLTGGRYAALENNLSKERFFYKPFNPEDVKTMVLKTLRKGQDS